MVGRAGYNMTVIFGLRSTFKSLATWRNSIIKGTHQYPISWRPRQTRQTRADGEERVFDDLEDWKISTATIATTASAMMARRAHGA